jgi:rare lipoprotein A
MYKMTAAHPTLPIPSYARVTNLANGKQVVVRVNDRGPFHSGRIIDLSYTAALKLGYVAKGSSELEVERLLPDEITRMAKSKGDPAASRAAQVAAPARQTVAQHETSAEVTTSVVNLGGTEIIPIADMQPASVMQGMGHAVIAAPQAVSSQGYYLQLGAFAQAGNAEAARLRMAQNAGLTLPPLEVVEYGQIFRLYSGPFATREDADAVARQLQAAGAVRPMIVQR